MSPPPAGLHCAIESRQDDMMWSTQSEPQASSKAHGQAKRQRSEQNQNHQKALLYSNNYRNHLSIARRCKIMRLVGALVAIVVLVGQRATASPPVDYFVYTSQLSSASAGTQHVSSILQALKSIYAPAATTNNHNNNSAGQTTPTLDQLAERVLSLVRNTSHSHDNDLADLEATRYAWGLMERQARLYINNRIDVIEPPLFELLDEAQLSAACNRSIAEWLRELRNLSHWATLMWNSWGDFPPAGLYSGSFTDLGSYRGCMSVEDNPLVGQAQYCLLDFQPIVPARPRFHSIFKRVLGHRNGQLDGGDFLLANGRSIDSRQSAHHFASTKFESLYGRAPVEPGRPAPDTSRAGPLELDQLGSKYSKRTIDHTGATLEPASVGPQQIASSGPNVTLSAEALIEFAKKAQYFYYVKLRVGACLPSKCTSEDVSKLARTAGQRAILQSIQVNCMKKEPTGLNTYQKVAIWILSILALIAVCGTAVDLLGLKEQPHGPGSLVDWLLQFSIWTNSKRLFDLETAGTHGDLECVHGLRFFSMLWVIYGHTILYMEYQSFTHFYDVVETQIPSFILLPSLNANFSVDTFFVISGILTTYVTWEYTKGDPRKFNKFAFLISRYIRLTPQLAIVILCFFLLPLFGDGPMYRQIAEDKAEVCYKNWAINLLYLQSYINSDKLCIDPSWWLSIEMTFHVVSVLVIIVMIQNVQRGMVVNLIVAVVLTFWGSIIHYSNGFAIQYLPSIPQRYEVSNEQTKLFFHRPYPHAASYFIGIALGYVLANKTIKKLSRSQVVQGWTISAIGIIVSLWGSYYWNLGAPYTQIQATIYYNLCQILWPTAIAWIILACSLGHGGYVNSILSARCFVPLGRVTYMTYLSHALIIYFHSASMNIPIEPSMLLFSYLFIANTCLALSLGVVLTVVYESPILNLQKKLFSYLTRKFDPTSKESECLPTRLSPTTQLQSQQQSLLINNDNTTMSNNLQNHNNVNSFKNGSTTNSTANCLLLDSHNNKINSHEMSNCNGFSK